MDQVSLFVQELPSHHLCVCVKAWLCAPSVASQAPFVHAQVTCLTSVQPILSEDGKQLTVNNNTASPSAGGGGHSGVSHGATLTPLPGPGYSVNKAFFLSHASFFNKEGRDASCPVKEHTRSSSSIPNPQTYNGTVSGRSVPQSGSLDVAAVVLLRPLAVSGLHGGGEGGVVHGLCQHHLSGPCDVSGQDRENRVRSIR